MNFLSLKKFLVFALSVAALFSVLFFDGAFFKGTSGGIKLVLNTVIPSTFPFLIISSFILESNAFSPIEKFLGKFTERFLRLPKKCTTVILLSFIGGYPMGAILANKAQERGYITVSQLNFLLCFCVMGSPSFIIGGVGRQLLGDKNIGIILYISNLISAVITAVVFSFLLKGQNPKTEFYQLDSPRKSLTECFVSATSNSCSSMGVICGYVILFSAVISFLNEVLGDGFPFAVISSLLEVTSGSASTAKFFGIPAVAFVLSFSGFAIHFQIFSVLKGKIKHILFILARIFAGILSLFACKIALCFYNPVDSSFSNFEKAKGLIFTVSPALSILLITLCFFMLVSSSREKDKVDFTADL